MSNRDIKLVLPAFLYSFLLLSNNLFAMDPPPTDPDENPTHLSEVLNSPDAEFNGSFYYAGELFIKNNILSLPGAEALRDYWHSNEYQYLNNELALNLYKHKYIAAHIFSIGDFLSQGHEGVLLALVHLTRYPKLIPSIVKAINHFTPDKFPKGNRSEIADKLLRYLDDVCHKEIIAEKYREIRLSNYSAREIVDNITMKMQDLLRDITDQDAKAWCKDNTCKNSFSNYQKFIDDIRLFFLFEFLLMEDEKSRNNFITNLNTITQYFIDINNISGAASASSAIKTIQKYRSRATIENPGKVIDPHFMDILHPNPECLSSLPNFGDIMTKYTTGFEDFKKRSQNGILELCLANRQLTQAKKTCFYSLNTQPEFMYFLDTIDFNEKSIKRLYKAIFINNQNIDTLTKVYREWSTVDLFNFFRFHRRMDLLRRLFLLEIMDGATLYQNLSSGSDESIELHTLLEPLLEQLLAGQIGSIKEAHINTNIDAPPTPPTSPTKSGTTNKKTLKSQASAIFGKQPTSPLKSTDSPTRERTRKKDSLPQERYTSPSSSNSSRQTFSESSGADSPERMSSREGLMVFTKEGSKEPKKETSKKGNKESKKEASKKGSKESKAKKRGSVARQLFPDETNPGNLGKVEIDLGNLDEVKIGPIHKSKP